MQITDIYSHKGGKEYLEKHHGDELKDIYNAVENINFIESLSKLSYEDTKRNPLFSPININNQLAKFLLHKNWLKASSGKKGYIEESVHWNQEDKCFEDASKSNSKNLTNNRKSIDGLKNKVGLEIQMGKYAFMAYDIFVKLPIFAKAGLIDCAVELVFKQSMIKHLSTGIGSFEQCVMEMQGRGESNIDIPTIVLGFECSESEFSRLAECKKEFDICLQRSIESGAFKNLKELKSSSTKRDIFIKEVNTRCQLKIEMGNKGAIPGPIA